MPPSPSTPLAGYTTLRLGGPAEELVVCDSTAELVETVRAADASGTPLLVLGGGSNVVVPDDGWPGTVALVRSRTFHLAPGDGRCTLSAAAGEDWDGVVDLAVECDLQGIECLSGIPGTAGATPIQNVGAYGQDVSGSLSHVEVWDRIVSERRRLSPADLRLGYRSSALKGSDRFVVLEVGFDLVDSDLSGPVVYPELARTLGVPVGSRVPLGTVREAVLALRRSKGTLWDPADPESRSAGSFFTNPVLDLAGWEDLVGRVRSRFGSGVAPPSYPAGDGLVKTSAAWLVERAGFTRGTARGPVRVSNRHTLSLVTEDGATAADLLRLADEVISRVGELFGVRLEVEPRVVTGPQPLV